MNPDVLTYNHALDAPDRAIAERLVADIGAGLPEAENRIWHGHPVWFLDGNPVAGYSKRKVGVVLMFWSGQSFDEDGLEPEGSFKAAQVRYTDVSEIDAAALQRWLSKARDIQWDYKNIVRNKGELHRIGTW